MDAASAQTLSADAVAATIASDGGGAGARELPVVDPAVYERLGEHARGGLGRIVRARDLRTGRLVAIKEMLAGTPDAAARFAREAIVTANLQHPAIVPVYEVGRWLSGEPFFAMKLVAGRSLADAIADARDRDARVGLLEHVARVADALAHAHSEGWIHRDLKPHNVLVGDHGETVVIDWGLARRIGAVEDTLPPSLPSSGDATVVGSVLGTPAYMPPEQALGEPVDERADVYALGAILRHVLAGEPPYRGRDATALIAQVIAGPPPPIAEVAAGLPADLVAIVERAMARDPATRYPSAREVAADLRRFTTGQLVSAHHYGPGERLRRVLRRHRATVAVAAIALAVLAGVGAWAVARVVAERDRAVDARADADRQRDAADARLGELNLDRARGELLAGRAGRALPFVDEARRLGRGGRALDFIAAEAHAESGGRIAERAAGDRVQALAFLPGSRDVITAETGRVVRWRPEGNRVLWQIDLDGVDLAMPLDTGTIAMGVPGGVRLLDAASGATIASLVNPHEATAPAGMDVGFGRLALAFPTGTVAVWDVAARHRVASFVTAGIADDLRLFAGGRLVAVSGCDPAGSPPSTIWDIAAGRQVAVPCPAAVRCRAMAAVRDGVVLARADGVDADDGHLVAIDGALRTRFTLELGSPVFDLVGLGDRFALIRRDGAVELHDAADGHLIWRSAGHGAGFGLVGSDDGTRLIGLASDGEVDVLDAASGTTLLRRALGRPGLYHATSDDGRLVAVGSPGGGLLALDVGDAGVVPLTASAQRTWRIAAAPDGAIVVGTADGVVSVRDATTGTERQRLRGHTNRVSAVRFDPHLGLLTASLDGDACRWNAAGVRTRCWHHGAPVRHVAASSDGRAIATAGVDAAIKVWDAAGTLRLTLPMPTPAMSVRWTPDDTRLAAIDERGDVRVWDAATGAVVRSLDGVLFPGEPATTLLGVTIEPSPDGRHLAVASRTSPATLLALDGSADVLLSGGDALGFLYAIAFDPSGQRVLLGGADAGARIWDVATGAAVRSLEVGEVFAAAWSPDGAFVVTGGADQRVHLWDAATGAELYSLPAPDDVYGLSFADAATVLVGTDGPTALVWHLPTS